MGLVVIRARISVEHAPRDTSRTRGESTFPALDMLADSFPVFSRMSHPNGCRAIGGSGVGSSLFARFPHGCITEVKHLFMLCWVTGFSANCLFPTFSHFSSELFVFFSLIGRILGT